MVCYIKKKLCHRFSLYPVSLCFGEASQSRPADVSRIPLFYEVPLIISFVSNFRVRKNLRTHVGDVDAAAVPCGFGRAIGNKVSMCI